MKPRDLIACFFAGFGVYLVVVSLFGLVSAVTMIFAMRSGIPGGGFWSMAPMLVGLIPMLVGVLVIMLSSRLGALAARAAQMDPETNWNLRIPAVSLLAIVIATIGLYVAATHVGDMLRVLMLLFVGQTGGTTVVRSASMQSPHWTQVLGSLASVAAGVFLAIKCSAIAAKIMPGMDPGDTRTPTA